MLIILKCSGGHPVIIDYYEDVDNFKCKANHHYHFQTPGDNPVQLPGQPKQVAEGQMVSQWTGDNDHDNVNDNDNVKDNDNGSGNNGKQT